MDFDPSLARALAQLSKDAYTSATIIGPETDTQVLVSDSPGCRVFSFRGTEMTVKDFFTDLNFDLVPLCGTAAKVHHGFLSASNEVYNQVLSACLSVPADTKLMFTGHSLGAALAKLLALRLVRAGVNVSCVYTFGSPRIGNAAWRELYAFWLGQRTWRVCHASDAVPRLPWWFKLWWHVDKEKRLGCWRPFQGLHEHHIDEYLEALESLT